MTRTAVRGALVRNAIEGVCRALTHQPLGLESCQGCLLGLALGDALGAPYEGGPIERLVWGVIGRTRRWERRWTDDTQMSLDLAESLVANGGLDQADLARRFARSYRWSRGYGAGTRRVLKAITRGAQWPEASRVGHPEGSYGNGAAMRAPVVALFFGAERTALIDAARRAAEVTHAHPLAIEGAVLVANATALAARGADTTTILAATLEVCALPPFRAKVEAARRWLLAPASEPGPREVARALGHGIAALDSCVTALYLALRFRAAPLVDLLTFVAQCRGDTDTLGAMAGAIWGAANGMAVAQHPRFAALEQRERIARTAAEVCRAAATASGRASNEPPAAPVAQ